MTSTTYQWNPVTLPEIDLERLDPGVRELVAALRARGFNTTDSGDGKTKLAAGDADALDVAHVFIRVARPEAGVGEANRLFSSLGEFGLDPEVAKVELSYDPADQIAMLALFPEGL